MSPLSAIRCQIALLASRWSASVVRMNRSKEMFSDLSMASNTPELRAARSRTSRPSFAAVCCIFRPCSSVPVRKYTSKPSRRLNRAIASEEMYS